MELERVPAALLLVLVPVCDASDAGEGEGEAEGSSLMRLGSGDLAVIVSAVKSGVSSVGAVKVDARRTGICRRHEMPSATFIR